MTAQEWSGIVDHREMLARLRKLGPDERQAALRAAGRDAVFGLDEGWEAWVRAGQSPPPGDWTVWAMTALLVDPPAAKVPRVRRL